MHAFIAAYATLGYEPCFDGILEQGFEKLVIYAKSGLPTHAARQLPNGLWTSKLGREIDVEHDTPDSLVDEMPGLLHAYGRPMQFLRRNS